MSKTTDTNTAEKEETMEQQINRVDENVTGLFAKITELQERVQKLEAENAKLRRRIMERDES